MFFYDINWCRGFYTCFLTGVLAVAGVLANYGQKEATALKGAIQ